MKTYWFKRWGWIYRPSHPLGFLLAIAALGFCVNTLRVVDRHAHSASDTLYNFYPFAVPTFLVLMWIAGRTSDETRN
jgi:hypothetical protein